MTLFNFIKQCLRIEAVRTEPNCTAMLRKIIKPKEDRPQEANRPP